MYSTISELEGLRDQSEFEWMEKPTGNSMWHAMDNTLWFAKFCVKLGGSTTKPGDHETSKMI